MATYRRALTLMLGICDGAKSRDGVGFSGHDAPFARSLYSQTMWSEKQENAVKKMLFKYRVQLQNIHGIAFDELQSERLDTAPKTADETRMYNILEAYVMRVSNKGAYLIDYKGNHQWLAPYMIHNMHKGARGVNFQITVKTAKEKRFYEAADDVN